MNKKWSVVQKIYKKSPAQLVEYGEEVVNKVTISPYFNLPNTVPSNPTLAEVSARLLILDTAISAPGGGVSKTDAIRVAKENVITDLDNLGNFIEVAANQPATKTIGDVVIHDAGMQFKKSPLPKQRVFTVINSPVQQLDVIARTVHAGNRAAYEWQLKKANEVNWQPGIITLQATFTFTGLLSGTRYQFRVKTVTKNTTNLSQVLELVVM